MGGSATGCVTLRDRQTSLRAHIRSHNKNTMPYFVTFVDTPLISGALPEVFSISISMRGYVQTRTKTCRENTTVQNWIPSAVWNPVLGGLASNSSFKADTSRSEDPNDLWTQMSVYGSLSWNNLAPLERKTPTNSCATARKAQTINFQSAASISQTTFPFTLRLSKTSCIETELILQFTPNMLPSAPPGVTKVKTAKTRLNFFTGDRVFQSTGTLRFCEIFKLLPRLFLAILRSCSSYD
jgi:hypothetical protein